jgi:hypothetical protein
MLGFRRGEGGREDVVWAFMVTRQPDTREGCPYISWVKCRVTVQG